MKKIRLFLIPVLILLVTVAVSAQCPMCRMTAESNMRNGGSSGAGLNAGILYMLVVPYLIVGGVAYWWWKNKKKNEDEIESEETGEIQPNSSAWN